MCRCLAIAVGTPLLCMLVLLAVGTVHYGWQSHAALKCPVSDVTVFAGSSGKPSPPAPQPRSRSAGERHQQRQQQLRQHKHDDDSQTRSYNALDGRLCGQKQCGGGSSSFAACHCAPIVAPHGWVLDRLTMHDEFVRARFLSVTPAWSRDPVWNLEVTAGSTCDSLANSGHAGDDERPMSDTYTIEVPDLTSPRIPGELVLAMLSAASLPCIPQRRSPMPTAATPREHHLLAQHMDLECERFGLGGDGSGLRSVTAALARGLRTSGEVAAVSVLFGFGYCVWAAHFVFPGFLFDLQLWAGTPDDVQDEVVVDAGYAAAHARFDHRMDLQLRELLQLTDTPPHAVPAIEDIEECDAALSMAHQMPRVLRPTDLAVVPEAASRLVVHIEFPPSTASDAVAAVGFCNTVVPVPSSRSENTRTVVIRFSLAECPSTDRSHLELRHFVAHNGEPCLVGVHSIVFAAHWHGVADQLLTAALAKRWLRALVPVRNVPQAVPGTITYNLHHRYTPPVAAALVARLDAVAAQKFSPLVAYGSPREVAFSALEGTLPPLGSNNSGTSNVTLADLACEQSADARQRAIMWPRTRLFTPGTPVSTVFSDATAELLHCGYQRPDHPCTTGQSFRAIHSQLPNYVAKAELTRFSGQPGYKLLSRTVTAAHARLLAHELGLHVAMKVPEVGLYRLPHNPRRNATTTYLHLHAQRMHCVKQLQQRQQCQAQQQCQQQQQQSRGVWKCPTAQSKRVLEALETHIAFDDTDHLLFSERIDLADIHTVAAVVARLSGNEAALLLAGALHTVRLLQVGDVNNGNLGLHAAEAAAFLAARPQAGGEADNDGVVLPRLVLLDWDSADAGCPRRGATPPSPGPNTLASLEGDAAQWHEWRRRRAWSSHRALILLLHANPVARSLADKVMAMLDG